MNKLISNIDKLHTTTLGIDRIKKNLEIDDNNIIEHLKKIILDKTSTISKKGKNYYVENKNIIITINSYSYTIITAHKKS